MNLFSKLKTFFTRQLSSFTMLNVTQFLGALNDNIYKLLIVFFLIHLEGIENSHIILSTTGAVFVLPFLLFSASSGVLADRFSKRNIIVMSKLFEFLIMLSSIFAFSYENKYAALFILFLLATQSAIFGPSKYGILPEIVETEKITQANGLMTSFTFLAIIIGTFCASFLLDITGYNFIFASIFCTSLSLMGVVASLWIEYTPPSGSSKRFNILFLSEIYQSLRIASNEPSLVMAIVGVSFFLFLGAFCQLNTIPYAVESLGLTDIQGGYLFLLTALGIGSGSLIAGKISGKSVELGLVPIAGFFIALCSYYLDVCSDHIAIVIPLVVLVGMFGGIFQIPLDSYIQVNSPHKYRGQIIAAANFLSFFGVLMASALLYFITEILDLRADKGFTIIAAITLMMTTFITYQFFDYLTRFIGMTLSRMHFQVDLSGDENIPETPAVYVCTHTDWNDTLLLLGSQRRRIRFFIEEEQDHNRFLRRLYRMLRVVLIPTIEPLEYNQACIQVIKKSLQKGISVCIFVENPDVQDEIEKLNQSWSFREVLGDQYPMVPVAIEKGTKIKQPRFFKRLQERFRVPAAISFG